MKRFFMKILLLTSVFYFSDLYCMKKFLKRYCCCCCCCANTDDDDGEFTQEDTKEFIEELKKLTPNEIDRQIEEFAQQVKKQPQFEASIEQLKEFFKKNRSRLKKWFAQYKKKK